MFPKMFPNSKSANEASIVLGPPGFCQSEGGEKGKRDPSPLAVGRQMGNEPAWLSHSPRVFPSGERSGEHPASAGPQGLHRTRPRVRPNGLGREAKRPTVAACVRHFCLECLGATSGRGAFDCGSMLCPLRPASPFLGKSMPPSLRPPEYDGEPPLVSKRRPSVRFIHAQCRQCQPGDRTDCEAAECALYPFRPWPGPGKAPRRNLSDKRLAQIAAARQRSPLTLSRKREQKATTAVGAAFDA